MNSHKNCPVCNNNEFRPFLKVKDHFLTKQDFTLQTCPKCGLVLTNPFPEKQEIGKYYDSDEYYSHPEKSTSFFSQIYEAVKKVNIKYKFKVATSGLQKGSLLDIGCGSGDFLNYAKEQGWNICGVEPNEKARQYSKDKTKSKILSPDEVLSQADHLYDVITMWHVLEHVEDLNWQCQQLKRLLKPGGRLIIALPNIHSYDAQHYKEYWAAYDVPRHLYHFGFSTIRLLLSKYGFNFLKREPLKWDAYYIALLSEKYKSTPLTYPMAVLNAWKSNVKANKSREYSSNIYIFYAT